MIKTLVLAFSLLVSLAVLGSDPVKGTPLDTRCNFSGKVLDKTNLEALTGAIIEIKELGTSTYASFDGSFTFQNTPVGRYTVVVKYVGYIDQTFTDVAISGSAISEKFRLTSY
ncbi:carboxypeptidase-like regulatory domain-containing protein [Cryomorpha ignava]|uniref:carboxypeptidase-like regulatory domain-containing protein n=1 Tax=Cryomorpha ignava TaxID=101383 RepID=UPI001954FD2A|nr:carboxypeptidase-like regulatory domain-containing protein [Cryomorpha ignava]